MLKIVIILLFSLNLYAFDSRSPADPIPGATNGNVIGSVGDSISKVDLFAKKTTFDLILTDKSFLEPFTALTSALDAQWPTISAEMKRSASKELDRYNMSFVFGLEGNSVRLLGSKVSEINLNQGKYNITADLYYRIEVSPSFIEGKQLRKDIYVIGLHESSSISAGAEVRITFFREFDSKVEAILAGKPYGLSKIPRNSDDVMTKLKLGDGIRIEAFTNLEISDTVSKLTKSTNLSAVLGYDLFQGLFMLDIYKYTFNDVRARFMGTMNRGTLKAGVGLNWLAQYGVGGILSKLFKDIFDVNFNINITKSFNFYNDYPIETHIADYFFRFNSPSSTVISISKACNFQAQGNGGIITKGRPLTAEAAFDELIGNVRSGQFLSLFNPSVKEEAMSATLLKNASIAETLACEDQSLPYEKKRVMNFFKGRMAADVFSLDFGPKISRLLKANLNQGHSEIFVSSVEQNQDFKYYLLLNSYQKYANSYIFGRWENEYISDIDALYLSDKEKNVVNFLDFVKRIQYKDKVLSVSNLKEVYTDIDRSLPNNLPNRDKLLGLIPMTEQRDGLISLVYTLNNQIVAELDKMDRATLYKKLYNFIDKHPKKYLMNVPQDNSGERGGLTFNEYVNGLYFQIVKFADSKSDPKERYLALRELMHTPAFTEYIFTELLPTFISPELAADSMSVQMNVSSSSIALDGLKIGNNQYSSVYSAVLLLRSLLNDRSLDLRLQSVATEDGGSNVNPMSIKGFKIAN